MTDDDGTDRDLPDPEDVIAGYDPKDEEEIGDDLPDPSEIIQIHQRIEDEYNLKRLC